MANQDGWQDHLADPNGDLISENDLDNVIPNDLDGKNI